VGVCPEAGVFHFDNRFKLNWGRDRGGHRRRRHHGGFKPPSPTAIGGLAFLVGGNMAIAASGEGGILVRVDPDETQSLVAKTPAEVMVMRGRPMEGWLRVPAENVRTKRALAPWVKRGTEYAASLPAK